ncbi:hypothetical protein ACIBQ1_10085 [Nonomuraea sp. NPDC050153]|uniref:hypothetical protein n=1 Tax=Nonomuraea sp. NPDC050153 TaxID=3364359 RepID=UPI0037A3650F
MTRNIGRAVAWIVVGVIVDLLEAAAYLIAIGLLTAVLGTVLPLAAAFVIALLSVSVSFGYRMARRVERARRGGQS